MKIEVVGTGCVTCQRLHETIKLVAAEIGPEATVAYVSDQEGMKRLMELGLMQSPALVVNGKVVMVGYGHGSDKLKSLILENA